MTRPLSALLSRGVAALAERYAVAGAGSPPDPSVAMWRTLLRAVPSDSVTEAELLARSRLSRRALRTTVTGALRAGWITAEPANERGAGRMVALTADGIAAQARWPAIERDAMAAWRDTIGADLSDALHRSAMALVVQLDLEWPHHPVTYGGADPSITGGRSRPGSHGPPRVPDHGQDWRPVIRVDGGPDIEELPLDAALSQLLCAFASDYEQERVGSIAVARMLRGVRDDWVPVSALPPEAGVGGRGTSLLERHGLVELGVDASAPLPTGHAGNTTRISPSGRVVRDSYGPVTDRIEQQWWARFGTTSVAALRSAAEAVDERIAPHLPDVHLCAPVRS